MGQLSTGPLSTLVKGLAAEFGIREFVETGTYEGDGCAWASTVFPSVTTIEKREDYQRKTTKKLAGLPIRFLLGSSADVMPVVVSGLSAPALFWLDGHSGGGHFGPDDDCPLLAELAAIAKSPYQHFIIIDDARAFLAPPPAPFIADRWPNIADVLDTARAGPPKFCVVIADTIIAVPPDARRFLTRFCQELRPRI